jgi:hypothetical protein
MRLADAKSYMGKYLHPYFEHKRYMEVEDLVYRRSTTFGESAFVCSVTGDDDMAYVKFFLGIRHDLVEKALVNGFGLGDYFRHSSHTLLIPWSDIDSDQIPNVLPCKGLSDLKAAGDWAISFMDERGFDFLNHYKRLSALDRLFNDKVDLSAKWARHSYLRCFRAMAIARIMNRSDYDRLYQMHRQYLEKRGYGGKITAKFEATFARMKRLSLN